MRYFISSNAKPLIHISSGEVQSKDPFIHPRRIMDCFVILFCTKGSLYIAQNEKRFCLKPNQYIILFPNEEHYGYKVSEDNLSYSWCHFKVKDDKYRILNGQEKKADYSRRYFLPETGTISSNNRALLLFRQLLDLSRTNCYSDNLPNYALSLLALEISQEQHDIFFAAEKEKNPNMERIIEWIWVNYNQKLTCKKIAAQFGYNSDYLSTCFKTNFNIPLMKHIAIVRIEKSKELLLNTNKSVKEIAYDVGFSNEKVFLKRFKQLMDSTPTKYRNAFFRKKLAHSSS